jgi:hypothetical protein
MRLVGTIMHKEPLACLEDIKSHKLFIYRIGDQIGQRYKVSQIKRGEVIFENDLDKGTLQLWAGAVLWPVSELSKLVSILPQADAKTGEFLGLRLAKIKPDAIIKMTGVKEGDLINNINGQALSSMAKTAQVIKKAKKLDRIELSLLRNGQLLTVRHEFRQ